MLYEFLDILFVNLISLNLVTVDGANHSVVLFFQLFYPDERLKEKGKSVSWVYKCHTSFELSWYLWIKIFHLHCYAVCNMHVKIFICYDLQINTQIMCKNPPLNMVKKNSLPYTGVIFVKGTRISTQPPGTSLCNNGKLAGMIRLRTKRGQLVKGATKLNFMNSLCVVTSFIKKQVFCLFLSFLNFFVHSVFWIRCHLCKLFT